jgi:hypothetical protein
MEVAGTSNTAVFSFWRKYSWTQDPDLRYVQQTLTMEVLGHQVELQ